MFQCASCGASHDVDDISFGAAEPAQWRMLSEAERAASELTSDQCIIRSAEGETHHFVRACLEVPIGTTAQRYAWGVWVSLSQASFDDMHEHWSDPARTARGPYFGWLCTEIPGYPDTMFLKTHVHQRDVGLRPLVELEPTAHPLAVHQRDGVEPDWLYALIARLLHE